MFYRYAPLFLKRLVPCQWIPFCLLTASKSNSRSSVIWSAVPIAPIKFLKLINYNDWAAAPKGSMTYGTTQRRSEFDMPATESGPVWSGSWYILKIVYCGNGSEAPKGPTTYGTPQRTSEANQRV